MKYVGLQRYLPLRFFLRGNPWRKLPYSKAERTYLMLEELGTTFIKLGQILSTRADLLPPDYIKQLSKLQSSLKQLPAETMKKVISDELGKPVEQVFASFDPVALGVASIGQVHAATLPDGTEVVVKIQKPGVQEQVAEDMDILRQSAVSASQTWEGADQYDLVGIVEETAETLMAEMDYMREGHSAEYFAGFFHEDPTIHIPRIFWESTTSRVLTMERIRGIPILDIASLDKAGLDRKSLAKRSADLWLKMVFESGMFHADPHPGNLFVESNGHLELIDFGMVTSVDEETKEHLVYTVKVSWTATPIC
jgi:ubiquinone biosynthesis protein